jgi:hypothetical protein
MGRPAPCPSTAASAGSRERRAARRPAARRHHRVPAVRHACGPGAAVVPGVRRAGPHAPGADAELARAGGGAGDRRRAGRSRARAGVRRAHQRQRARRAGRLPDAAATRCAAPARAHATGARRVDGDGAGSEHRDDARHGRRSGRCDDRHARRHDEHTRDEHRHTRRHNEHNRDQHRCKRRRYATQSDDRQPNRHRHDDSLSLGRSGHQPATVPTSGQRSESRPAAALASGCNAPWSAAGAFSAPTTSSVATSDSHRASRS